MTSEGQTEPRGWVLYDAGCGFCNWWVPFWEPTLARRGFAIAPLHSSWVREQLQLDGEDLVRDIRLLLSDGALLSGGEVYLYVMERIWWARPLAWIFRLPGLRWVFERTYLAFNRNRMAISRACGLPSRPFVVSGRQMEELRERPRKEPTGPPQGESA